uniref:Uncharacterized protein n=1 Tax=Onchocerca volvulus TaxID=6282 RepID=A0A8R1TT32_ONCVO
MPLAIDSESESSSTRSIESVKKVKKKAIKKRAISKIEPDLPFPFPNFLIFFAQTSLSLHDSNGKFY